MAVHSFFDCLASGEDNISRASTFTGSFNKARVRGGEAEEVLGATNSDNGVNNGEGARNGENGAGLAGKARTVDLRVESTLNTPEGSESTGTNLVVKALRESNISSTEQVPQTRETDLIVVDTVFSFGRRGKQWTLRKR